jgi:hypothetical protein
VGDGRGTRPQAIAHRVGSYKRHLQEPGHDVSHRKRPPKEPFFQVSDPVQSDCVQAALTFRRQACNNGSV